MERTHKLYNLVCFSHFVPSFLQKYLLEVEGVNMKYEKLEVAMARNKWIKESKKWKLTPPPPPPPLPSHPDLLGNRESTY